MDLVLPQDEITNVAHCRRILQIVYHVLREKLSGQKDIILQHSKAGAQPAQLCVVSFQESYWALLPLNPTIRTYPPRAEVAKQSIVIY